KAILSDGFFYFSRISDLSYQTRSWYSEGISSVWSLLREEADFRKAPGASVFSGKPFLWAVRKYYWPCGFLLLPHWLFFYSGNNTPIHRLHRGPAFSFCPRWVRQYWSPL